MGNNKDLYTSAIQEARHLFSKKNIILTAVFLVFLLCVICISVWAVKENNRNRIEKINKNMAEWKESAVTEPKVGALKAAGPVTITWKSADSLGDVKGYKVYVNDELVKETDEKTTSCEYYTTKVSGHKVYVEAELVAGSKIYSNIFTFYVNKKGHCVNKNMSEALEGDEWGGSWYYNWDVNPFTYTSFQELEYVPMFWNSLETHKETIKRFPDFGYKHVLAFNEPDRPDQANMSVDEAIEGMKVFNNYDLRVGAPATALCPPWSTLWFQPFMNRMEYEKMDVDFIPIHHYWNWYQKEGAEAFLELVEQSYEMYKKPIWITEFAIIGNPGNTPEQRQKVIDYMNIVIPALDEMEFVERYAWFSFSMTDYKNGASSLIQSYTGEITDLGRLYQKLGMPEGYKDDSIVRNEKNPKKDIIK